MDSDTLLTACKMFFVIIIMSFTLSTFIFKSISFFWVYFGMLAILFLIVHLIYVFYFLKICKEYEKSDPGKLSNILWNKNMMYDKRKSKMIFGKYINKNEVHKEVLKKMDKNLFLKLFFIKGYWTRRRLLNVE